MRTVTRQVNHLHSKPDSAGAGGRKNRCAPVLAVITAMMCLWPTWSAAFSSETSAICDRAAEQVAAETLVPASVLRAITRTETGRGNEGRLDPWPWTVNMQGKGLWFDSEDDARAYVFSKFKEGARSFDVGCFQINYKWHGAAFQSIDQMFDPLENGRYAAKFLTTLHSELGSWEAAAGAYHSRTKVYADRYKARFRKIRAEDQKLVTQPVEQVANVPPRKNTYPLLRSSSAPARRGSLVPLANTGGSALVAFSNPGGF